MTRSPPRPTLFPYTTLFRSRVDVLAADLQHVLVAAHEAEVAVLAQHAHVTRVQPAVAVERPRRLGGLAVVALHRSEEHTSELQSLRHLVCRLLLEKKKKTGT